MSGNGPAWYRGFVENRGPGQRVRMAFRLIIKLPRRMVAVADAAATLGLAF